MFNDLHILRAVVYGTITLVGGLFCLYAVLHLLLETYWELKEHWRRRKTS